MKRIVILLISKVKDRQDKKVILEKFLKMRPSTENIAPYIEKGTTLETSRNHFTKVIGAEAKVTLRIYLSVPVNISIFGLAFVDFTELFWCALGVLNS